jgi:molybdenum cofactor cytidylyltransferase
MGQPKLNLPLGNRTVIEHVITTIREAGIERIVVVVGPGMVELAAIASSAGAHVLELDHATPDMRSTIERGLDWIEACWQPVPLDDLLLIPADLPAMDRDVIRELLKAAAAQIRIPVVNGKRGHPALLGWQHVPGIRAMPPGHGLNAYLRQHADSVAEVPVISETALLDLDTPEDYERMKRLFEVNSRSPR